MFVLLFYKECTVDSLNKLSSEVLNKTWICVNGIL